MSGEEVIRARGVGRRFGRHWALAHIDLDVRAGEVVLLAGPNGSGKTTLLRILAALAQPTMGELRLLGSDSVRHRLVCRRALSFVSHQSYLYDRLTAREMLRLWARLTESTASDARLDRLLGEVGLVRFADELVGTFSAGMRKRLTLLRTRLEEPQLVLLDEPFAALDPEGQQLIEAWIADFRSRGVAVVLASHALSRACRLCDRAMLLQEGQFAWQGRADLLLQRLEATA